MWRARRRAVVLLILVAGLALPPAVRADGDPASDVLAAQSLFLPQDAAVSARASRALAAALTAGAARSPLRVAVIASASDLGAVTALWRQPQSYARFLGQEVSLLYRGEILVVMPGGFGLARDGRAPPASDAAVLARLPVPGHGLTAAALAATRALLTAHGVLIPALGSGPRAAEGGGGSPLTWVVLGLGVFLIALAWGYSLRARPLGRAGRTAS